MDPQELHQLKASIAEVYARRERLKLTLAEGALSAREGLAALEVIDLQLSALDSLYKTLWDSTQPAAARRKPSDSSGPRVQP